MTDRLFHFTDEKSNKFWRISIEDRNHTVTFGRMGTAGQTQTKEFGSEEQARSSYDKLIQEKLSKGYVEVPVDGAASPPAPRIVVKKPREEAVKKESPAPEIAMPENAEPPSATSEPRAATINLDPGDWYCATWRNLPPLPKPPAPPFDRDDALRRLKRVTTRFYGWEWDWSAAKISPVLSREEAEMWLRAMFASNRTITPQEVAATLQFDHAPFTMHEVRTILSKRQSPIPAPIVIPLANLFGAEMVIDLVLDASSFAPRDTYHQSAAVNCIDGVRRHLLPWLDEEERARFREKARKAFPTPAQWPASHYQSPAAAFYLGAVFGLHDEVHRLVESWPDDLYTGATWMDTYHLPQELVFGLGSAREVEMHMRRLRLPLKNGAHIRAWLAHTETSALDFVRDSILLNTNKEEAAGLVQALALVHAPEVVPFMLELMLTPRTAKGALEWMQENADLAAIGLLPVAAGRGAMAQEAIDLLRSFKRRGFETLMRNAAEELPADARERIRATVLDHVEKTYAELDAQSTPAWLRDALGAVESKKKKGAAWVTHDDLPPITIGEAKLNREQVAGVLDALRSSKLEQPHPLLTAIRANADRDALDRFAWRLFELWLMNGAEAKENWAMLAVGLLGGDASALKLTPMIRVWPGESQHARAVLGLECLRTIGTDTALMQINGIAQKLKFKGLKTKAAECMEKIAEGRGLTRAQLEDRIVPDCDLDERGSRVFDFGPRRFTFVLGPDMKPLVRDESGKTKPDLPKPGAKDDPDQSAAAVADWKLLKKQIAEVAKIQAVRLEQAMVTGRQWSDEEFDLLLVKHPLMTNLVRLVVWAVFDEGRAVSTFRVTEDQTLADPRDHSFTLPAGARVGIAHPLQLSEADKNTWGELFTDYEIIPPFAQLGRSVHALQPGESSATEITRFAQTKMPPQTLVFTLEKLGWERGIPQDAGVFFEHSKPFYGANVTAVVQYEGVPVGYADGWDEQSIERCFLVPGIYTPHMYPDHKDAMTLATVDPIVISEVLSDLEQTVSKVK